MIICCHVFEPHVKRLFPSEKTGDHLFQQLLMDLIHLETFLQLTANLSLIPKIASHNFRITSYTSVFTVAVDEASPSKKFVY